MRPLGAVAEEVLTQEPAGWTLHSHTAGNQCDTGLGYQSLPPAMRECSDTHETRHFLWTACLGSEGGIRGPLICHGQPGVFPLLDVRTSSVAEYVWERGGSPDSLRLIRIIWEFQKNGSPLSGPLPI